MRSLLAVVVGVAVLLLAFWAYQENYRTRQVLSDLRQVQREIGALREDLTVLNAEWAYLNRPGRLRELADLNFETLGLMAMRPDHFGYLDQVAYPPAPDLPPGLVVGEGEAAVVETGLAAPAGEADDEKKEQFP